MAVVADDYDAEFVVVVVAAIVVDVAVVVNVAAVDEIQEPVSPGSASRSADDA